MKIETVLAASDMNPLYSEFIPSFIKSWSILFPEVDIIVVLVADSIPDTLLEYSTHIRLFKPIDNIHTAFQAQCIRLLYPQFITRNGGVLITDMDMLPMNRFYYEDAIKNISDDTFISYRDVLLPYQIPMCYNIALPNVWKNMFDGETLENWYLGTNYSGIPGTGGWCTDQHMLMTKFNEYSGTKIILNDDITKFNRLDRSSEWQFYNLNELRNKIGNGEYSDYHSLRPYSRHKELNDFIVESLIHTRPGVQNQDKDEVS